MDRTSVDLAAVSSAHIVGIGGAGMSAIATVLSGMGIDVTGSDLEDSHAMDNLRAAGIPVSIGHDARHVGRPDFVAISTAVPPGNIEVRTARDKGIPVVARAVILSAITAQRRTVAVAGTHGKTTTSSMLAWIMSEVGMNPSFVIGGTVSGFGAGARWTEGEWLVAEADESDGTFLELSAYAAVITNVEPDHIEHYGSFDKLVGAFEDFSNAVGGALVVCADDPGAAALPCSATSTRLTYGTSPGADFVIDEIALDATSSRFRCSGPAGSMGTFQVPVPGLHNVRNAAAALAMVNSLGGDVDAARSALVRFGGVSRRFQFTGSSGGATFVDDYAHLPAEIASALAAARAGSWKRIVCVFQPHRYSRIETLWESYADAFCDADLVLVSGIYPAGESPRPGVSGKLVVDAVSSRHPGAAVEYLATRREVVERLCDEIREGDLCITLSAGDMARLVDEVAAS